MAGGFDLGPSGRNGKKPLDAVINLVPFIDLMAVTIAFLMFTAVWVQVGRLQVSSTAVGAGEAEPVDAPPLTMNVTATQIAVQLGGTPIGRFAWSDLPRLKEKLIALRREQGSLSTVTLHAEDQVRYEDLVRVVDVCLAAKLGGVAISPETN